MSRENPSRADTSGPSQGAQATPNYFLSVFGAMAMLTLLLPLTPVLPDLGRKTRAMAETVCLLVFFFVYMQRRVLWESELRRSIRGAQSRSVMFLVQGSLAASLVVAFFLSLDGAKYIQNLLGGESLLAKLVLRPLQMFPFVGFTYAFSVTAALDYMAKLEKAGIYRRPAYLREDVDLPDLAADLLRANLQVPQGVTWKIIERGKTPSGGVKFVMSWVEEVTKTTSRGESIKLVQEKKYAVELDIKGRIVSFREQKG